MYVDSDYMFKQNLCLWYKFITDVIITAYLLCKIK